jgi:uncharacterized protein YbgA (DUF1722 family)
MKFRDIREDLGPDAHQILSAIGLTKANQRQMAWRGDEVKQEYIKPLVEAIHEHRAKLAEYSEHLAHIAGQLRRELPEGE